MDSEIGSSDLSYSSLRTPSLLSILVINLSLPRLRDVRNGDTQPMWREYLQRDVRNGETLEMERR